MYATWDGWVVRRVVRWLGKSHYIPLNYHKLPEGSPKCKDRSRCGKRVASQPVLEDDPSLSPIPNVSIHDLQKKDVVRIYPIQLL